MKLSLTTLFLLTSVLTASAEGAADKSYVLNLNGAEVEVVAKALIEQPYKFVGPLFDKIKTQVAEQNKQSPVAEGPKEKKD